MAHFAELDSSNTVQRVIVVSNETLGDLPFPASESAGVRFCCDLYGWHTRWRQTSYNANFRKNYAGIGFTYDATLDAFVPPQPFASWTLDTETCQWNPPTPRPVDGKPYKWDEAQLNWVEVIPQT